MNGKSSPETKKVKISFLVQRATKKNSSPFGGLFFFIIVIENDPGQDFLPLLLSQNFFHYFHLYGINNIYKSRKSCCPLQGNAGTVKGDGHENV